MTGEADTDALHGVGVLVTRPGHQSDRLCRLIEQRGGKAIAFPVLEILDPVDSQALAKCVDALETYDWAIFISANAVDRALTGTLARRGWPETVRIAVVGKRSAEELRRFGLAADACPERNFTSEALLALPEMQAVGGSRVVIFRGNGGREYLAEILRQRGAEVDYVEAYQRICPQIDSAELVDIWHTGPVDVVLVNSVESLENLVELAGDAGRSLLLQTPLIVASERILPVAHSLGFESRPVLAESATDEAMLNALLEWKNRYS